MRPLPLGFRHCSLTASPAHPELRMLEADSNPESMIVFTSLFRPGNSE